MKKIFFNPLSLMKNFAFILTLLMAADLSATNYQNATKNSDAHCKCDGSVTVSVQRSCFGYIAAVRFLDSVYNESTSQYELRKDTIMPRDTSSMHMNESITINNLCPGTYRFAWLFSSTSDGNGNPYWTFTEVPVYETVVIEGPDEFLSASLVSKDDGDCYGTGSATVGATGGTPGYTYSWTRLPALNLNNNESSMDSLGNGSYRVIVTDANGCKDTVDFLISGQQQELTANVVVTPSGCDGSSNSGSLLVRWVSPNPEDIEVTVNKLNPTTPMSTSSTSSPYLFSGLAPGEYEVILHDTYTGCERKYKVIVTAATPLVVTSTFKHSGCDGGMASGRIDISIISGTPPYQINWSPNNTFHGTSATGLAPGTYTVTVTDAKGCVKVLNFTINQVPELSVAIATKDVTIEGICHSRATVIVEGGTPPYTYNWGSGFTGLNTETKTGFPVTHTVTIRDANGCEVTEQVTNQACESPRVVLFPNPNYGSFTANVTLASSVSNLKLKMYTMSFTKVYDSSRGSYSPGIQSLPVSVSLSPGAYYFVVESDGNVNHEIETVIIQ